MIRKRESVTAIVPVRNGFIAFSRNSHVVYSFKRSRFARWRRRRTLVKRVLAYTYKSQP